MPPPYPRVLWSVAQRAPCLQHQQMNVVLKISQSAAAARESHMSLQACVDILCELKVAATAHKTLSSVDDDKGCWQPEKKRDETVMRF